MVIGLLAVLFGGFLPAASTDYYVASTGNDSNSGTISSPWLTIAKVNAATTTGKTVHFRGGDTFNDAALTLKTSTNYTSYGTGRAVISGGLPVTTWTQIDVPNNIWRATWNGGRPRQLFVNGIRVVRARTTTGLPSGSTVISAGYSTASSSLPGFMSTWGNQGDIDMVYFVEYRNSYCPVTSIVSNTITMNATAWSYFHGVYDPTSFSQLPSFIENAYEIFTANNLPGTFYQDRTAGFVYLIPPPGIANPNSATVIAPIRDTIASGSAISSVNISNLEFSHTVNLDTYTDGFAEIQANMTLKGTDINIQTSWRKPKAALLVSAGTSVNISRCVFSHLGTAGPSIDGLSSGCTVAGCIVYDVSSNGVQVGDPNQNAGACPASTILTNNFIFDAALEFNGGVGSMQWWANATTLTHCEITNLPYSGISNGLGWGAFTLPNGNVNNVISYNHVFNIMDKMNDGGGIYSNSINTGQSIDHNYVHDLGTTDWVGTYPTNMSGIYLDDGSQGTTTTNNVVGAFLSHPYYCNNNIDGNPFSTNTADTGTYFQNPGAQTLAPNSTDTLNVVSASATVAAGLALTSGLQAGYSDVYAEGVSLFQTSHCKLELDGDNLTGSDGASISSWADSSGTLNSATQATSGLRPIKKTNILNGHSVARFDGADDFLDNVRSPLGLSFTVIAVAKFTSSAGFPIFYSVTSGPKRLIAVYKDQASSFVNFQQSDGGSFPSVATPYTQGNWGIFVMTYCGQRSTIRVYNNAAALGGGQNLRGAQSSTVGALVGGSEPLQGDIAYLQVYDALLSEEQITTRLAALATKYGL